MFKIKNWKYKINIKDTSYSHNLRYLREKVHSSLYDIETIQKKDIIDYKFINLLSEIKTALDNLNSQNEQRVAIKEENIDLYSLLQKLDKQLNTKQIRKFDPKKGKIYTLASKMSMKDVIKLFVLLTKIFIEISYLEI